MTLSTVAAAQQGQDLYAEFQARVEKLHQEGLLDCKTKLFVGTETTTASVVMTFNNALRLREAGRVRPLALGID